MSNTPMGGKKHIPPIFRGTESADTIQISFQWGKRNSSFSVVVGAVRHLLFIY